VGPAGLTGSKEIKDLSSRETIGIPDVSPCLSQFIVSLAADKKLDFEPLEHSVYCGRQRLGRYVRIAARRYAAYDSHDRLLGDFKKRKDAWAAVSLNAGRNSR
jgi:hypothetical protein